MSAYRSEPIALGVFSKRSASGGCREYPDLYLEAEQIEAERGHTFRSPQRDAWPAALKDLRREFDTRTNRQHDLFRGNMQCRVCRL
jgi:hypothetical protein